MQSVDGDTAQVPPQIAEELHLPCITYVTKSEYRNNRFEFTRIISGGSQVVAAGKVPAVITVARYEYPLFATFAATRRANKMEIIRWGLRRYQSDPLRCERVENPSNKGFPSRQKH